MYVVIAGLSDVGKNLAVLLARQGDEVIIVDLDPSKCNDMAEGSDVMVITGDASQKAVLEEAGIRKAYAFVAAAGDDSENLMLCMIAREMGARIVISLVDDTEHEEAFKQAGVTFQVNLDMVAARHISRMISQPYVKDFMTCSGSEIVEVEVETGMKCVGRRISELKAPKGIGILVTQRGGRTLDTDDIVRQGDWLTLIVNQGSARQGTEFMEKWFAKG